MRQLLLTAIAVALMVVTRPPPLAEPSLGRIALLESGRRLAGYSDHPPGWTQELCNDETADKVRALLQDHHGSSHVDARWRSLSAVSMLGLRPASRHDC
jgi:hypothetical protein